MKFERIRIILALNFFLSTIILFASSTRDTIAPFISLEEKKTEGDIKGLWIREKDGLVIYITEDQNGHLTGFRTFAGQSIWQHFNISYNPETKVTSLTGSPKQINEDFPAYKIKNISFISNGMYSCEVEWADFNYDDNYIQNTYYLNGSINFKENCEMTISSSGEYNGESRNSSEKYYKIHNHRVKNYVGTYSGSSGFESEYYNIEVDNVDGCDISVDELDINGKEHPVFDFNKKNLEEEFTLEDCLKHIKKIFMEQDNDSTYSIENPNSISTDSYVSMGDKLSGVFKTAIDKTELLPGDKALYHYNNQKYQSEPVELKWGAIEIEGSPVVLWDERYFTSYAIFFYTKQHKDSALRYFPKNGCLLTKYKDMWDDSQDILYWGGGMVKGGN